VRVDYRLYWWVKSGESALQAGPGGTQEYVWTILKKLWTEIESGVVHSPLRSENDDDVFQQDDDVKVSVLTEVFLCVGCLLEAILRAITSECWVEGVVHRGRRRSGEC
jgi:hypothetical protein